MKIRPARGQLLLELVAFEDLPEDIRTSPSHGLVVPNTTNEAQMHGWWRVLAVGGAKRRWSKRLKRWTEEISPVPVGALVFAAPYEQDRRNIFDLDDKKVRLMNWTMNRYSGCIHAVYEG